MTNVKYSVYYMEEIILVCIGALCLWYFFYWAVGKYDYWIRWIWDDYIPKSERCDK